MKVETQATLLEKMMQDKKKYSKKIHLKYVLALPLFMVKQFVFKKLAIGDILLLGLENLELILTKNSQNNHSYANVRLVEDNARQKIEIISINESVRTSSENVKYETMKCIFSKISIEKFEVGAKQSIENIDFSYVEVLTENNVKKAEGKLVQIDEEIAIEITKIYDEKS